MKQVFVNFLKVFLLLSLLNYCECQSKVVVVAVVSYGADGLAPSAPRGYGAFITNKHVLTTAEAVNVKLPNKLGLLYETATEKS
jgi:hypothetical protein